MIVVVVCIVLVLFLWAWSEFGDVPSGLHLEKISSSSNYDATRGRFVNRRQSEYDKMLANFDMKKIFRKQMWGKRFGLQQHHCRRLCRT